MSQEPIPPKGEPPSKNVGQVFLEELLAGPSGHRSGWRRTLDILAIPVLAIFTGLIIGGLIIVLTSPEFYEAWKVSWLEGLKSGWGIAVAAYTSLFTGAIGNPANI